MPHHVSDLYIKYSSHIDTRESRDRMPIADTVNHLQYKLPSQGGVPQARATGGRRPYLSVAILPCVSHCVLALYPGRAARRVLVSRAARASSSKLRRQ